MTKTVTMGFLPQASLASGANGAPAASATRSRSLRRWRGIESTAPATRTDQHVVHVLAGCVRLRQPDGDQVRIASEIVAVVEDDVDGDVAGKGQGPAVAHAHGLVAADETAVLVDAPEWHLVDDIGSTGRELHDIAVAHLGDLADAGGGTERGLRRQVRRLAMDRTRICGRTQVYIWRSSLRRG